MARSNNITKKDIRVLKILQGLPVDENGQIIVKLEDIKPDDMSMGEFKETLQFVNNREITPEERAEVRRLLKE